MSKIELDFNLFEGTFNFGYGDRLNPKNLELLNKIYLSKLQQFELTCFDIELIFNVNQIDSGYSKTLSDIIMDIFYHKKVILILEN